MNRFSVCPWIFCRVTKSKTVAFRLPANNHSRRSGCIGFDRGVTVLGGLPVPIATPAHGTAYDIAGASTANLEPVHHAFLTVCAMVERRADKAEPSRPRNWGGSSPSIDNANSDDSICALGQFKIGF